MSVTDGWINDPEAAQRIARTEPRDPKCPPHWLRCDHVKDGQRCKKGDGHTDEHEAPKE